MFKLATFALFIGAQFVITWYGAFLGRVPAKGSLFGWRYDSPLAGLLVTLIAFIWIPLVINMLYGLGFQWGNRAFGSFLVVISLWIAAAPIAALLYNILVARERLDLPVIIGLLLVTIGGVLIAAHREIAKLLV
ncbi:MAG: hypothetical protein PHO92_04255 [Candidatus Peribacteraceae bacterium]|nr:hypothetical protein [Candidatus Peribacteraceae bacterium]